MSDALLKTRTAKCFLRLYRQATLREAVEAAVQMEREVLLTGLEDSCRVPVDVQAIAERRGIGRVIESSGNESRDAQLFQSGDGFLLQMNPFKAELRKRFTLAHEIGHTLFHRGGEHLVGVLSKSELETEEKICHMFARALLMPVIHMRQLIQLSSEDTPWNVFKVLESAARKFRVTLPALLSRLGDNIGLTGFSYVLFCLQHRENQHTGTDPSLRVQQCVSLGKLAHLRGWKNRSAKGLNLLSAQELLGTWIRQFDGQPEQTGGLYVLTSACSVKRASSETLVWRNEDINMSILKQGKWYKETLPMKTASCLVARQGWTEKEAYIVSILRTPG